MPSDFAQYMLARERKIAAKNQYNYASQALQNAQIFERLAEIKSQDEPLTLLLKKDLFDRDKLYAAAYYVVVGRMPDAK